jgi:peptide/nickel transport system substrate-binding protein
MPESAPASRAGRSLRLAAVLVLAAAASACATAKSSSSPAVREGGVFRLGTDSGIDSLNPFVAANTDSFTTFEYIYPELVQYGANLQIAPDFASKWSVSPGGLTWTFHTRSNARWSDGKPLTAADAAWTINTDIKFASGATGSFAPTVSHMASATAPSPTTLVIRYRRPVANVLPQLQQLVILPQHIWSKYATGNGAGLKTFSSPAPVVSGGPFELVKYVPKQVALFKRNPYWWGPKPHIDGFGLQQFANDDAMISALQAHQLDGIEVVPPTVVGTLRSAKFDVTRATGIQLNYFSVNANPKMTGDRELLDPLVREAFDHAVDRALIDRVVYEGYAQPAGSVISPATGSWYDPRLRPPAFDLRLANELLDKAGFKKGPNGTRMADGHPMSYSMIIPSYMGGPGLRMFQIIQSDFAKIGVQITERSLDGSAAFAAVTAPNNKYLTFQAQMSQWQPYVDPDFQLSVFLCGQYGSWNDSGYCNPAYDRLYEQQGTTLNPTARRAIVWKMEAMIYNARPYIEINYPDWIEAHSPHWAGFVMTGQGSFNEMSDLTMLRVHQVG